MNLQTLQELPLEEFPQKLGRIRQRQGETDSAWRQRALLYVRDSEQLDRERAVVDKVRKTKKSSGKAGNMFKRWSESAVKAAEAVFGMTHDDMFAASELVLSPVLPPAGYFQNCRIEDPDTVAVSSPEIRGIRTLVECWVHADYDLRRIEAKCDLACWKCEAHKVLGCFAENRSLLVGSPDFTLFAESE